MTTDDELRDRIMAAIREADCHSCMYQEGIDAGDLADAVMEVLAAERLPATGGIVQAAPTIGETAGCGPLPLTVRYMTPEPPRCESGLHYRHPGTDCDEQEQWQLHFSAFMQEMMRTNLRASPFGFTVTRDIPPALRGPNWPRPAVDPAPLRKLAERALAEGGPLPGVRPWSEVKVDMDRVAEELAGPESPGPEGLYGQIMAVYGVPLPPYKPRPQNACPCGGGDIGGQRVHDPHCPMHPARIRAVEALLDAQLPEQARVEGIHFEIEPEGEAL